MYEFLCAIFTLIFGFSVYGAVRYGFNIIFVYIMLFSVLVIVWTIAAIISERKEKDGNRGA